MAYAFFPGDYYYHLVRAREHCTRCGPRTIRRGKEAGEYHPPALFVYGDKNIRPSRPVEQVARLMPNARFELIEGAEHVIWFSRLDELRLLLWTFVSAVSGVS